MRCGPKPPSGRNAISRGASGFARFVDAKPAGEFLAFQRVARRAGEIGFLAHLHGPHARAVDREQQIAVRLQMMRAGIRRAGEELHRLRLCRIAHVDDGDAVGKTVADIGEAAMHHELHAVAAAALVAVAEEFDVVRRDGVHERSSPCYPCTSS